MAELRKIDRREFLQLSGVVGGGLVLGFSAARLLGSEARAQGELSFAPNVFVSIDNGGQVTIVVTRSEMGQGTRTGMPMILAEELGVGLDRVRVVQADGDRKYGHQLTGGSLSVRLMWEPLREAGATARTMLVAAAAERWGVDPSSCDVEDGRVIHATSGRELDFGELCEAAAARPLPDDDEVVLKGSGEYRLVGTSQPRLDGPDIVTGRARYGMDVRRPGLRFAAVARCPVYGGTLASYDADPALAVAGVERVVEVPGLEKPMTTAPGVAVIARDTWSALEGAEALEVTWDEGPNASASTDELRRQMVERGQDTGFVMRDDGDVSAGFAASQQIVEASYDLPYLAHAPMEPMNCTVEVRGRAVEIWTPTQDPQGVQEDVAVALGIRPSDVTVHVTLVGGGFGRRLYGDPEVEGALIARELDGPVMVVWTREDEIRFGRYRPMSHHVLRGGLDSAGDIRAWHWHIQNTATLRFDPNDFPAFHIPDYHVEYTYSPFVLPRGAWRSTVNSQNPFVTHCFFDELAAAAGRDPMEWRLQLLRDRPRPDRGGNDPYEGARMLAVMEELAERSGWGTTLPEGRGRGVAFFFGYGSYAAEVAEVTVRGSDVEVDRVVCVLDCGQIINPDLVQAQIEGGIVFGLSAALGQAITVRDGRVREGNFDDFPLLRMSQMPKVEGHLIASDRRPGGTGEPPLPPLAPAVANAIFAATGSPVRRLPIVA